MYAYTYIYIYGTWGVAYIYIYTQYTYFWKLDWLNIGMVHISFVQKWDGFLLVVDDSTAPNSCGAKMGP